MTFDPRTEQNIATLTPATQAMARSFLQAIIDSGRLPDGWTIKIISGLRTYAEQTALYAQGRTAPGPKVTNAPAGWSNHNFGRAFDLGLFDQDGTYIDDSSAYSESEVSSYYRMLAPIGKALGLRWGGDWVTIDDEPHYELILDPKMSEDQELAQYRAMIASGEAIA